MPSPTPRACLLPLAAGLLLGLAAGCAAPAVTVGTARTPLDPAQPDGETVALYWQRLTPAAADLPPVLLFHGGPGAPEADLAPHPFWRGLAERAPVVGFDQRGSGRSGPLSGRAAEPERAAHYRLVRLADDAEAVRAAALGAREPVVAFGVSSGAQLALLYALRHPEAVRALVLVEPAPDHGWVSAARAHLAAWLDRLAAGADAGTPDVAEPAALARGVARLRATDAAPPCPGWTADALLFGVVGRAAYTRPGQLRLAAALAALGEGDAGPLCALAPQDGGILAQPLRSATLFRTVACAELGWGDVSPANCEGVPPAPRLDLTDDLPRIRVPTLVLSSRHDVVIPPAAHDAVAAALGGPVTLHRLERSGHLPLQEEPAESLAAVLEFLRAL